MSVSSAKTAKVAFARINGKLFMKIKNKNGPERDPCGAPNSATLMDYWTPFR